MEYIKPATIVIVSAALLVFAACSGGKTSKNPAKIDSTIIFNYRKAYDYDFKTQQKKLAEVYYKKVYDALKDDPDMNRELYTRAGYSLAALKSMRMDFEGSMVIALEMYKTMEANDSFKPAQRETILSLIAGRNAEIAELYDLLDSTYYSNDGAKMNFDNICYRLTPRYMANLKAGRIDDALKIGSEICEAIDSAVVWQRKDEAAELAVIYQTHEKEMALEESKAETRIHRLLLIGITLICMLIGYLLWRSHRYNRILASKNRKLFAEIELNRHEQQQEIAQLQAAPLEELSTEQQLYRRICMLMDEQKPYTDVTLNRDALAQMLGTNAKYVEQAIRQCSKGETVSDYINRYRLEHVARLLKNTNHPIAVIGEISGIPSRATLGRLFRIAYGMTPSEYRSTTPKY